MAWPGLLSERRRDWVEALLAETDDLPSPSARLAWLGGGLWLVVREVVMNRIVQALAFAAGAVGLVWIAWPGASTNSATPVNRMYVVGTLVLLAGLPLLVRRYAGPVRAGLGAADGPGGRVRGGPRADRRHGGPGAHRQPARRVLPGHPARSGRWTSGSC